MPITEPQLGYYANNGEQGIFMTLGNQDNTDLLRKGVWYEQMLAVLTGYNIHIQYSSGYPFWSVYWSNPDATKIRNEGFDSFPEAFRFAMRIMAEEDLTHD